MLLFFAGSSFAQEDLVTPGTCRLEEYQYAEIWTALREASHTEGRSIGVRAEGFGCEQALDKAIRSGPFPGVHRTKSAQVDTCVVTLTPDFDGYMLTTNGACKADASPLSAEEADAQGPARLISVAWWLPVGASLRWNERLSDGVSGLVDLAFGQPEMAFDDSRPHVWWNPQLEVGSEFLWSSQKGRLLTGVDVRIGAHRERIAGSYLGARSGLTWTQDRSPPRKDFGMDAATVSLVGGHKWIGDGLGAQLGAGIEAGIPTREASTVRLTPVLELRLGLSSVVWR